MPRNSHVSIKTKELIIKRIQEGVSYSSISKQLEVPKSTIGDIWKRFRERGDINRKPGSGRPRKTTPKNDRVLKRLSQKDPRKSAVDLNQEMRTYHGVDVSVSTTKRRLCESQLFGRCPAKKPMVTLKNRKTRLAFARKYQHWTFKEWSKVLWSDETQFLMCEINKVPYVRRPVNERYKFRYQIPTIKHGGGSLMLWGCFSSSGVGPLVKVEGIMDQVQYRNILQTHMLPFGKSKMPRGWLFQHDNDPKHTARSVKSWLKAKKVRILDWPSQSPDLNPIENLWNDLKRRTSTIKVSNAVEKFQLLQAEWQKISVDRLTKLINSMPHRCNAVIKAMGYPTKY